MSYLFADLSCRTCNLRLMSRCFKCRIAMARISRTHPRTQTKYFWIFSFLISNRVGPNSEYGPNTELFIFWKWTNTEYWIVLFGHNYLNNEYCKSNSSPPKHFICEFCDQMRWGHFDPLFSYLHEGFLLCFIHISCL